MTTLLFHVLNLGCVKHCVWYEMGSKPNNNKTIDTTPDIETPNICMSTYIHV